MFPAALAAADAEAAEQTALGALEALGLDRRRRGAHRDQADPGRSARGRGEPPARREPHHRTGPPCHRHRPRRGLRGRRPRPRARPAAPGHRAAQRRHRLPRTGDARAPSKRWTAPTDVADAAGVLEVQLAEPGRAGQVGGQQQRVPRPCHGRRPGRTGRARARVDGPAGATLRSAAGDPVTAAPLPGAPAAATYERARGRVPVPAGSAPIPDAAHRRGLRHPAGRTARRAAAAATATRCSACGWPRPSAPAPSNPVPCRTARDRRLRRRRRRPAPRTPAAPGAGGRAGRLPDARRARTRPEHGARPFPLPAGTLAGQVAGPGAGRRRAARPAGRERPCSSSASSTPCWRQLRARGLRYVPCDLKGGHHGVGRAGRHRRARRELDRCDALLVSGMTLGNGTLRAAAAARAVAPASRW